MKIEGNAPNPTLRPTGQVEGARSSTGGTRQTGGTSQGDSVELSPQAQLADRIRQAAKAGPTLRQDRVDQARQKLAAGNVGQDPMALADHLIDHMLED